MNASLAFVLLGVGAAPDPPPIVAIPPPAVVYVIPQPVIKPIYETGPGVIGTTPWTAPLVPITPPVRVSEVAPTVPFVVRSGYLTTPATTVPNVGERMYGPVGTVQSPIPTYTPAAYTGGITATPRPPRRVGVGSFGGSTVTPQNCGPVG